MDFSSVPALTAIASLIAASVAAVVALCVAVLNTRSARRLAIDTAHREYRQQLVEPILAQSRAFYKTVSKKIDFLQLFDDRDPPFRHMYDFVLVLRQHFVSDESEIPSIRPTGDAVFDQAVKDLQKAIGFLGIVLDKVSDRSVLSDNLVVQALYEMFGAFEDATTALELAAEGYVFGVRSGTRRACEMHRRLPKWFHERRYPNAIDNLAVWSVAPRATGVSPAAGDDQQA